ncbi:iron ABC transporter substrate-binding protein [Microvirga zambiensis]|uniref:iron ABC transporter substrate-binding protein n=1 Tax=Microvirga zambiensis TaxID=1402137 RepID=UPI00192036D2|nr:iron ABC transporter substrate-binding protein [Microvirga zambiensis]
MLTRIWMAALALSLSGLLASASAQPREVVDAAGRSVPLPAAADRVFTAGPPASVAVYMVAPEKLVGWVRAPSVAEKAYLAKPYASLPEHGRLTGRGNTANLEVVLAAKPDLILDIGSVDPTYASLADRTQAQTGIPYILLDGAFARTPEMLRDLGRILGAETRAEELARYAKETLDDVAERIAAVPPEKRPRVYYGRGPRGLETGLKGSINTEILSFVGAENVAALAGSGSLATVSVEQVLAWNPDVILTQDSAFARSVRTDPSWGSIQAVRDGRIYRAPALPFGWFDAPPGVNRLIGIRWLARVLYPDLFPENLRDIAAEFYRRFYHVSLSPAQLDELLADATGPQP